MSRSTPHAHPLRKKAVRYVRTHLLVVFFSLAVFITFGALFAERAQYLTSTLYSLTPTPVREKSPLLKTLGTIQWRQYEDAENGYTVKYPPLWTFLREGTTTTFGIGDSPEKWIDIGYQIIILTEDGDEEALKQTLALKKSHFGYRSTFSEEYVLVDGAPAVTLTDDSADWPRLTTYLHRNGKIYTITLVYFTNSLIESVNLYPEAGLSHERFISSFHVLTPAVSYACPQQEYVDCMPIIAPERQEQCSPDYLAWATENCPQFKGAAY